MVCLDTPNMETGSIYTIYGVTIELVSVQYYPNIAIYNITSPNGEYYENITLGQGNIYIIEEYNEIDNVYYRYTIKPRVFYGGGIVKGEICQIDTCAGITCIENLCYGTNLYEPECVFGMCVPNLTKPVEMNSELCGYIPPPEKPFPWWLLLIPLGYIT